MNYIYPYIILGLSLVIVYEFYQICKYKKQNISAKSLVAGIVHDLKSPVCAQINMLNMILKTKFGVLNSQQQEMLKLTLESSKYMSNLISTILTDYQLSSKALNLNKTKFNLIELVNNVLIQNEYQIYTKNQKFIFQHQNSQIYVYADKLQIQRAITNLVSNAIIHGYHNSTIVINVRQKGFFAEFSISNKGLKLNNKEIKEIFSEFVHAQNTKSISTGLGLSVAKEIINLHRGKIYANCNNEGIFTFKFIIYAIPEISKQNSISLSKIAKN